jgi:hypothetical protein
MSFHATANGAHNLGWNWECWIVIELCVPNGDACEGGDGRIGEDFGVKAVGIADGEK